MESMSIEQKEILADTLMQIRNAINGLLLWNEHVDDFDVLLQSPGGMQDLAGNCMLIMAIAEGFKNVDKRTDGKLLPLRSEIPWHQVFGLRNRIAHGYFDIDVDVISSIIKDDLKPLLSATDFFIKYLSND